MTDYKHHTKGIDLHIHSTASDGTLTPCQIIEKALKSNLKAISITDHDTVEGCKEALSSGIDPSLHFLTGVEISAIPPSFIQISNSFHLLGYNIDIYNDELNKTLSMLQDVRKSQSPKIIKKLNRLGCDIDIKDIEAETSGGVISRNHIANALIKKGFVSSINEAFNLYIGNNGSAYVTKKKDFL